MSYLNALASGGLSVGLRIANSEFNSQALRRREEALVASPEKTCCQAAPEKIPPAKVKTKPDEMNPADRAAGRAEAYSRLGAEGCLGQIQACGEEEDKPAENAKSAPASGAQDLSEEEKKQVEELKKRDREVKTHEQAHVAAAAGLAGAPSYEYQTGPDGQQYAVGGHVNLRTSGSSDPEKALREAETVKRAATAPAEPSSTDRSAAAGASADINRLKAEIAAERQNEGSEKNGKAFNGDPLSTKALGVYNAIKFNFAEISSRGLLAQA